MTLKDKIKKTIATGLAAISLYMPMKASATDLDLGVRDIQGSDSAYTEVTAGYTLPESIEGFTFIDSFDDGSYFGKTSLTKDIGLGDKIKSTIIHADDIYSSIGLGMSRDYSSSLADLTVGFLPLWFDKEGDSLDQATLDYFVSVKDLPFGLDLTSFGEWIISEGSAKFDYGEIMLSKKVGDITIGYNPALIGDGDSTPDVEQRISIGYDF